MPYNDKLKRNIEKNILYILLDVILPEDDP